MSPGPIAPTTDLTGQHRGTVGLVVDVLHEGVLDGDATLRLFGVVPGGVEQLVDFPTTVNRDELITQLVVRGV